MIFAVIAKEGRYRYLNLSGSQLINWYLTTARSPPPPACSHSLTPSGLIYSQLESQFESRPEHSLADVDPDASAVVINSHVGAGVRLGARLVLVDSVLPQRAIASVGSGSFLSCLKSYDFDEQPTTLTTTTTMTTGGSSGSIVIPVNIVLQGFWVLRAPLVLGVPTPRKHQRLTGERDVGDAVGAARGEDSLRVLVVWGVDYALDRPLALGDEQSTFCGQMWGAFLQRTGIRDDDLWFASKVCSLFTTLEYEYEY